MSTQKDNMQDIESSSFMEKFLAKHGPFEKDPWFSVPEGVYECVIQDVHASEKGIELLYDIAEGEYEGAYKEAPAKFDWTHSKMLSLKSEYALSRTAADLAAITASNEDFSAECALLDEDYSEFIGKRVGIVMRTEDYRTRDGRIAS